MSIEFLFPGTKSTVKGRELHETGKKKMADCLSVMAKARFMFKRKWSAVYSDPRIFLFVVDSGAVTRSHTGSLPWLLDELNEEGLFELIRGHGHEDITMLMASSFDVLMDIVKAEKLIDEHVGNELVRRVMAM